MPDNSGSPLSTAPTISTPETAGISSSGLGPIVPTIITRITGELFGTGFKMADAGPPMVQFVTGSSGFVYGDTTLVPRRNVTVVADGMDIRLTYFNNTDRPQPVGTITVGDLRLEDVTEVLDARTGADRWNRFDRTTHPQKTHTNAWPGDLYSPVAVIRDTRYTVGVSIQYPALEYRHSANIRIGDGRRYSTDGGPYWFVRIELPTSLAPGQTRSYTLSIRVAPRSESWLKTIVPYRDYFRATYGSVQYTRDPRPVTAAVAAFVHELSPSNQRGFAFANLRPDVHGWRPWARELTARRTLGYQRNMIWAAAGIYRENQDKNFPPNSLTPMNDIPIMRDSKAELANVASPSMQVGYWLGYATKFARSWDNAEPYRDITLGNAEEEGLLFRELDLAASLNATMIGLDAFVSNDPYFIHTLLAKIRQRHPNMKYIAEVSPPDLTHLYAGAFLFEWDVRDTERPMLADFIVPGHETWVAVWGSQMQRELGRRPTIAEFAAAYQRYSDAGYTILDVNAIPVPSTLLAARSWEVTVPASLREPDSTVTPPSGTLAGSNTGGNNPGAPPAQPGQIQDQSQGGTPPANPPATPPPGGPAASRVAQPPAASGGGTTTGGTQLLTTRRPRISPSTPTPSPSQQAGAGTGER